MKSILSCSRNLITVTLILAATHLAGAATYFWSQATPGSNNWIDTSNWTPTGSPGAADTAIFGLTGTVTDNLTVNNVVGVNTGITTLQYTNSGSGVWNVTQIPADVTLTVGNNLTVGGIIYGSATGSAAYAAMTGAGTLLVTGNTLVVGQGNSANAITHNTLDLSGLSNFVYSASSGTISVGNANRSAGDWNLAAASNSITAGTVNLDSASSSSSTSGTITLGSGTNQFNANTINLCAGNTRSSCTVRFPVGVTTGGLSLGGLGGTNSDRVTMTVAYRNASGSGGTTTGLLDLYGHPVDMKLNTLTLGRAANVAANTANGTLQFDTGTVDATNINLAICSVAGTANGTINVGTNVTAGGLGVLVVGSGGISLVNQTAGTATGNLNINGGTVNCAGNIFKTTAAGTANITLGSGSTLSMTAGGASLIGSPTVPVDTFSISDATLNFPVINSQAGATVATLVPGGSTNIINITAMPGIASYPAQFPLIAYTSLAGTFNFELGTLPGTYRGYISNNTVNPAAPSIDLVITGSSLKTDDWNGNVSGNWDTSTVNWRSSGSSVVYQDGDYVNFDDTLSGTPSVTLTTNVSPGAIGFNNSTHNYVLSGAFKITGLTATLTKQGSGSVTLAETGGDDFGGGITVNNGILILDNANSAIAGGLAINGGTAQIGNNDTNGALPAGTVTINDGGSLVFNRTDNITVSAPITGTGALTQSGSGTLTLSGANSYMGNTTIGHGTLALSGAGTIATSAAVSVNNATLDVSAVSQPATLTSLTLNNGSVAVAVNASGSANINTTSLSFAGAANHLNVASFPPIGSYPVTFTIIQSASAASGSFNLSVGTLPAATPAYAATVTQSADQTAVLLTVTGGPIGVRPAVFWTGADVPNLNTNWSDRLNWQLPGAPTFGENVIFNTTGTQTASALSTPGGGVNAFFPDYINNIVDASTTISSLTFTNLGGSYHNTYINSGRTLSITNTGGLTVGTLDAGSPSQQEYATISGRRGALSIVNSSANLNVWVGSGVSAGSQATLDLSALDSFSADLSRFQVGSSIGNVVNRPSGVVYLAKTNAITARFQTTTSESGSGTANAAIVVGDCNGNAGSASYIYLGQVNDISADIIAVARQKTTGRLLFNPIYPNVAPYPTVTFRGFSSSEVSIFDVGDGVGNTGTTTGTGEANFTGGLVAATVDTMNIGRASGAATGSGTSTGILAFDAGTITTRTLNVGFQPTTGSKVGIGTAGVSSNALMGLAATLVVRGNLTLGSAAGGTGAATTSGTLNITNGTVLANAIVPGTNGALSAINVYGGRLVVTNPIGNASSPLGSLTLASLETPDNNGTLLSLPVGANDSGIMVTTLNLDGLGTTTNIINIESVGPVGTTPVDLPLIQYGTMNLLGGTFNVGLGTLPSGYSGSLVNDTANSRIALRLTSALHPQPVISAFSVQSGTNLVVSGVNGFANASYSVVASADVASPLASWAPIATGVFGPNGSFSFTVTVDPATPQRFFVVKVP